MSNTPVTPDRTPPDIEAEEVASKHDIPVDDAKRRVTEGGHDRAAVDGAAEAGKNEEGEGSGAR